MFWKIKKLAAKKREKTQKKYKNSELKINVRGLVGKKIDGKYSIAALKKFVSRELAIRA